MPGVKWLLAAVGQVNIDKVRADVDELRREYPNDSKAPTGSASHD